MFRERNAHDHETNRAAGEPADHAVRAQGTVRAVRAKGTKVITVVEAGISLAMTTLRRVKNELTIPAADTSQDDVLQDYILDATDAIEKFCERTFAREILTETRVGAGLNTILLTKTPVLQLDEVRYVGGVIDPTTYSIRNREAGIVYRPAGWTDTRAYDLTLDAELSLQNQGTEDWAFDYVTGYLMPGEYRSGVTLSINSGDKSFNDSAGKLPMVVVGEKIDTNGFVTPGNNGAFTVVNRTPFKIIVVEAVTTEAADNTDAMLTPRQTFPRALERLCIDIVKYWYNKRTHDRSVKAETIGDYEVQYREDDKDAREFPMQVERALESWRRVA